MPREYNRVEAPFTVKLKTWMKYNMKFTYGWEVKYPKKPSYVFSQDKSFAKELRNLLIWNRTLIHKFSDAGRMGTIHDGFTAWNEPSFFFFTWNGKNFYVISAKQIALLIEQGHKSLTEVMAESICDYKGEVR